MKILPLITLFIFAYIISFSHSSHAQVPDSSRAEGAGFQDSTSVRASTSEIDTTIYYEAHLVDNLIEERITYLIGDAFLQYENMSLRAEKITVDWDKNLVIAEGVPDTVLVPGEHGEDSVEVVEWRGTPVLTEGGERMAGFKMTYNTETQKGLVVRGRTEFEGGFYIGQQMKKVEKNVFNISHGSYTTCDEVEDPHFHFYCRRMKMIPNDKVIAQGIVMYIGTIPVMGLPFAVFPHTSGRQSGILVPRWGQSQREGNYLRGLGYYWAPSEYYDAQATIDYFDRSGIMLRGGLNYNVRYRMRGSLSGSITRKNFTSGINERRWDLRVNHQHEFDPTMRLSASGYFVSDGSFYKDLSTNLQMRLNRQLRSNATFSKSWQKSNTSLSVNVSQVRNLDSDDVLTTLPQISFRKGQTRLLSPEQNDDIKWYNSIYYSYSSNLLNSVQKRKSTVSGQEMETETTDRKLNHQLNISMNSPKKFFGWLGINQSLNVNEDWFDRRYDYQLIDSTNTIAGQETKGFAARHTFSYNLSANTKIYGMFTPNMFGIQALRHVVTPTLSFNYQPDFSDPAWGYYTTVTDTAGREYKKDTFGGTPRGGQQRMSVRVNNVFQMKIGEGDNEKKLDLFTLDLSSGFNFKAEQYKLSDLTSSLRANPMKNFSLSASTSHSFYEYDRKNTTLRNDYLFDEGGLLRGRFARLTSLRVSASLRVRGRTSTGARAGAGTAQASAIAPLEGEPLADEERDILEEEALPTTDRFEAEDTFTGVNIPWNLSLSFSYSLDKRADPLNPRETYYLDVRQCEIQLTRGWRINYSAHFDLKKKQVASHRFSFYRDLHCWEAIFDWVPSGISKRFYLRIQVKAPHLRDLKLEARGGRSSVLGY